MPNGGIACLTRSVCNNGDVDILDSIIELRLLEGMIGPMWPSSGPPGHP